MAKNAYVRKSRKSYKKTSAPKKSYKKGGYSLSRKVNLLMRAAKTTEKKSVTISPTTVSVGQCNINADAYYWQDISPIVSEGTTISQRVGNQIKITSFQMRIQLRQMANLGTAAKYILEVFTPKNDFVSSASIGSVFKADTITGLVDYHALRNPDYYSEYTRIMKKTLYLKADSYSAQPNLMSDYQINYKFKNPMICKYANDGTTILHGQLFMVLRASTGNINGATASTLTQIGNTNALSGAYLDMMTKIFYTDT